MSQIIFFFRKILSTLAIFGLFFIYMITPFAGTYYLITGSLVTKIILSTLLVYQYFFCSKNQVFINFARYLNMMNYFKEYKLILDDENMKERNEKTLICHHPHGVMTFGMAVLSAEHPFFDSYVYLGSRGILLLPFGGIIMILRGIQGVNPENFKKLMKRNQNLIVIP